MNPPPDAVVSAAEVVPGAVSPLALAESDGGEVAGGSPLAVVSGFGWLDDEGELPALRLLTDGGAEDAEPVPSCAPI